MVSLAPLRRTKVLVLSGDTQLIRLLRRVLTQRGFELASAPLNWRWRGVGDGPDIVIADLPAFDAQTALDIKTGIPNSGVLALCLNLNATAEIEAVEAGVECIGRPFRDEDLLARLHVAGLHSLAARGLRRRYQLGRLDVDLLESRVEAEGRRIALTISEWRFLMLLLREPGEFIAYGALNVGLGDAGPTWRPDRMRSIVYKFRKKIAPYGLDIENQARVGYRLIVRSFGSSSDTGPEIRQAGRSDP
jgi:DNA-binding response OmpR family regulator